MPAILKIAVPVPLQLVFDYLPPPEINLEELAPGQRILIPFGPRVRTGYLLAVAKDSDVDYKRLRAAVALIDRKPLLSESDLKLLIWASEYYHHPIGEVISTAFPVLLRKGKPAQVKANERRFRLSACTDKVLAKITKNAYRQRDLAERLGRNPEGVLESDLNRMEWDWRPVARNLIKRKLIAIETEPTTDQPDYRVTPPNFDLNPAQKSAVESIVAGLNRFRVFLLEGITGSGKTEVYFQLIQSVLQSGRQSMVLVPEITLTPQLETRFSRRFNIPIAVFHSGLNETKRKNSWLNVALGQAPILLGTRSAVFTPLERPGLIILDEEHDNSFKQQEGFRFSARDIAIKRAQQLNIPIILGSATPSLESVHNVNQGRYSRLELPDRAGNAQSPTVHILDTRDQMMVAGLAPRLIRAIKNKLQVNEQTLLFINRRGYAPTLICHHCGWVAQCPRCDSNLVIHAEIKKLRCHHCLHDKPLPDLCEQCGSTKLVPLGLGTERIEQMLAKIFPGAAIARIDRDSTRRKGSLEKAIAEIRSGKTDILIGTQMLAKGHHFPQVTLVGILDTDSGLFSTDFRTSERLAQLIVQVSGRAGRAEKKGTVVIQTRHPDHPLLTALIHRGYAGFAANALAERNQIGLPPFSYQALLRTESSDSEHAFSLLLQIKKHAESAATTEVEILGPVPAPMIKRQGRYRYQLLLQSDRRGALHVLLKSILPKIPELPESRKTKWSLDIDPVDLF